VVVDDHSTDATSAIARQRGCRVVQVDARRVAAARNAGAASATGEIFAFVDGDMRIHPDTFNVIVDLRRLGRGRGQRLARARRAKADSSTRKFDRYGDWHCFPLLLRLLGPMIRAPETRHALVEEYWYSDQRSVDRR
jgi:glycosyltransferase involved in cell wall biosynthesis